MWGHMAETVEAHGYTFSRPKLAAEVSNENATVVDHNETGPPLRSGADSHCTVLPGMRHFGALATVIPSTVQTVLGWPMQGDYYWSSLAGLTGQHHAADVSNRGETQKPDSTTFLVSCVDKPAPDVEPKIVLTPENYDDTAQAMKAKVGEDATMRLAITDTKTTINRWRITTSRYIWMMASIVRIKPTLHGKPIRYRLLAAVIFAVSTHIPMKA